MESYTGLGVGYEPLESTLFICRKGDKLHGSAPSRIVPGFGQEAECERSQVVGGISSLYRTYVHIMTFNPSLLNKKDVNLPIFFLHPQIS